METRKGDDKGDDKIEGLKSELYDARNAVKVAVDEAELHKQRVEELETEVEKLRREIAAYENAEVAADVDEHLMRAAVPGPYHAVARGDDADVRAIELAMMRSPVAGDTQWTVVLDAMAEAALVRVLEVYKSDLHVSGAPDRVYSNAETVLAATAALEATLRAPA